MLLSEKQRDTKRDRSRLQDPASSATHTRAVRLHPTPLCGRALWSQAAGWTRRRCGATPCTNGARHPCRQVPHARGAPAAAAPSRRRERREPRASGAQPAGVCTNPTRAHVVPSCCFWLQHAGNHTERLHRTGRERMGSPTLQTLQDPILLLPWLSFRGGGFPNPTGFEPLDALSLQ